MASAPLGLEIWHPQSPTVAMRCRDRLHELVKEEIEKKDSSTEEWKIAMKSSFNHMDNEQTKDEDNRFFCCLQGILLSSKGVCPLHPRFMLTPDRFLKGRKFDIKKTKHIGLRCFNGGKTLVLTLSWRKRLPKASLQERHSTRL
ncbi:unnamed protein product [Camellia sinensis]